MNPRWNDDHHHSNDVEDSEKRRKVLHKQVREIGSELGFPLGDECSGMQVREIGNELGLPLGDECFDRTTRDEGTTRKRKHCKCTCSLHRCALWSLWIEAFIGALGPEVGSLKE
jgi:hypothetical protein